MSTRPGEEYVINRAMHLCYAFVQPTCFLAGNRARNDVVVVAFKNRFTVTELLNLHCIRILCPESSVSSKLFRGNGYGNKQ